MRIVMVSRNFVYPLGGFEEYIYHLIKKLSEQGLSMELLTTTMLSNISNFHEENINGVKLKRYPVTMKLFGYCYSKQLGKAVKESSYDIIHAQGWGNYAIDAALKDAGKKKKPLVVTPHGFFHEAERVKKLKSLYNRLFTRRLLRYAHFVAITKAQAEQLRYMGAKYVHVIPEGIVVREFEKQFPRPTEYAPQNKRIILGVGRISTYKGFEQLIEVLKKVLRENPEAHLIIVGQDWGARDSLEKLARNQAIDDHITFTGRISRENLIALYQAADVYVNSSRHEGFGITILEAMACGTPVISTKTGVAQDLEGIVLTYDYGDCEALAKKLIVVLNDHTLSWRLGEKGVRIVKREYDWSAIIGKITSLYSSLCS